MRIPIDVFRKRSLFGRIIARVPAPLKAFGAVATLAAATVVLAPAMIVLAGPPLLVAYMLMRRRLRGLQQMAAELHSQRWRDLASFHLQRGPLRGAAGAGSAGVAAATRIPVRARIVVEQALARNDQSLARLLQTDDPARLGFSDLRSLAQDFQLTAEGGSEKMAIYEYALLVDGRERATVRVVSREGSSEQRRERIELDLRNRVLVLKQDSDEGVIDAGSMRNAKARDQKK